MKKAIVYLSFLPILFFYFIYSSSSGSNTHYIYLQSGEDLVNKVYYENTIVITYACSCYARTYNMRFRCADTSKNFIKDKLPLKYYSMATFAELASREWEEFKDKHFWNDKIYIIEKIASNKYHYQLVQFHPIEHEE